jgi:23S rRNA pseudouridine1911/1915/1917 synthase
MTSQLESWVVDPAEAPQRLDQFLVKRLAPQSRHWIQMLIQEGAASVNNRQEKKHYRLQPGDQVTIQMRPRPQPELRAEPVPLDILFEDEHLLAVHKPAGLVVHPAPGNWSGTFANGLLHHVGQLPGDTSSMRPGIVHRLDKETSGLLLAAKTEQAHQQLIRLFSERQIKKTYWAICAGRPPETSGEISGPIGRHPRHRIRMAISPTGRPATTQYQVVATHPRVSGLILNPITGRTHQLRVHLQSLNCPILGDTLYGGLEAPRLLLHAQRLILPHPILQTTLDLTCLPPDDWQACANHYFGRELF